MLEMQSEKGQEISKEHNVEVEDQEEEKLERDVKQYVSEIIQSEFSGPIPPPNIIKGYEDVLPGSADRIIQMAEKQMEHRQDMEVIMTRSESRDGLLGVLFAFTLGICSLIASVVIVVMVPQNAGAISSAVLGVTGIGSIITTFLKTTRIGYNSSKPKTKKNSE